jgi:hypothetical protein
VFRRSRRQLRCSRDGSAGIPTPESRMSLSLFPRHGFDPDVVEGRAVSLPTVRLLRRAEPREDIQFKGSPPVFQGGVAMRIGPRRLMRNRSSTPYATSSRLPKIVSASELAADVYSPAAAHRAELLPGGREEPTEQGIATEFGQPCLPVISAQCQDPHEAASVLICTTTRRRTHRKSVQSATPQRGWSYRFCRL